MSSGVRSTFGAWKKDSVVECKGCHTWQHKNHNSCPKCGTSLVERYYDPHLDLLPPASVMSRRLFEDVGERLSSSTIIKHLKMMGWVKIENNSGWRKLE